MVATADDDMDLPEFLTNAQLGTNNRIGERPIKRPYRVGN